MNEPDTSRWRSLLKMQPTFSLELSDEASDFAKRIRDSIPQFDFRDHVSTAGTCIDFKIDPQERRFWSPHLSVQVHSLEEGSQVRARFSPRPEIWTMFMAVYGVMAIIAFGAAIFAYVQWFLGDRPWAIVLIPFCLLVIVTLHVASLIGQNLSADQMHTLHERFNQVVAAAKQSN
ncbi:hypothetical protein Pla22_40280 [Rubripirellula amarantea]|uniref:Uncharacterized protein n=1 Tax=Rubripirellula amarantea TaxID=2527999 RepID=A0A5C5WMD1_9BACT|nr:hypothetical protein [Rubripirellula amarantea]TWT51251.1 hypothetical protein Pla22_40280 [Rubripirellula amarantea]